MGAAIVKPGDRSPALNVVGVNVTVLLSPEASPGQQVTFQSGTDGVGPPPHDHPWDEAFYVTKGSVLFTTGGQTTACLPGTLVRVPAGTIHAFAFGPDGGEMLEMTGAGSQAIAMFRALASEVNPAPLDVPKAVEVAGRFGLTFHL